MSKAFQERKKTADYLKFLLEHEEFGDVGEFYLFGSTSMIGGKFDPDMGESFDDESDYDYALEYTEATKKMLDEHKGWSRLADKDYMDSFTLQVYQGTVDGQKVQISLKKDLALFKEAWSSISKPFYWKYINKRSPTAMPKGDKVEYFSQLDHLVSGFYRVPKKHKIRNLLSEAVSAKYFQGQWLEVQAG